MNVVGTKLSIMATGDAFITQRLPRGDKANEQIKGLLETADARFTNLEVTVHNFDDDVYPASESGGTWAAARPYVLPELRWLGLNLLTWANNHTLDWSHNGLLSTLKNLEQGGWVQAGVGRNLAEANQPRYLETPNGRVGIIGATSTFQEWRRAGEQRPDVLGRPGVNPLRYEAIHQVNPQDLETLKKIISQTDVNANRLLNEKEGFAKVKDGGFFIGNLRFEEGDPGTITRMHQGDAERIGHSIREAVRQADVVLVSHHAHEMKGISKDQPAEFLQEFAHYCIDQGAHAFLGHGPHILRGLEIYKGRPIFYSLGNFIFHNDNVEKQPTEFYDIYGFGPKNTPSDGFDARCNNGTTGLPADSRVFESVIADLVYEDCEIKQILLHPISLGFGLPRSRRGRPYLAMHEDAKRIIEEFNLLSRPYGTNMVFKNGVGVVELSK